MEVYLEILNPKGDDVNGLCNVLAKGINDKIKHI